MLFTPFSIVTLIKPVQSQNASTPILVTLSGIVILVKPLHSENADLPILVTLPSVGIMLLLQPDIRVFVFVSIRQLSVL